MAARACLRLDVLAGAIMTAENPILVVGAHRSGTSLTARVLETLGVFLGARVDGNAESSYMQRVNRTLLRELGAHWSRPNGAIETLAEIEELETLVEPLRGCLDNRVAIEFWGARSLVAPRPEVWGWKDPRTGILLPIWREIYPDLSLVWVRRHPVDCARSLHTRVTARQQAFAEIAKDTGVTAERRRVTRSLRRQPIVAAAWRALTPQGALDVTFDYIDHHEKMMPDVGRPSITVDYADLALDAAATVDRLIDFIGTEPTTEMRSAAAALPTSKSLLAWRNDPTFCELAARNADRITALGYDV